MFGRYGGAGGIGGIRAGYTFPNFSLHALRHLTSTGPTGRRREGVPEVDAVVFPSGKRILAYWLCHRCGGIDSASAREGLIVNPCPAGGAPEKIYITVRECEGEPRRLGVMGW